MHRDGQYEGSTTTLGEESHRECNGVPTSGRPAQQVGVGGGRRKDSIGQPEAVCGWSLHLDQVLYFPPDLTSIWSHNDVVILYGIFFD